MGSGKAVRKYSYSKRPSIHILFLLLITLNSLASCDSGTVMGIPQKKALENLKNRDIDFILKAGLPEMAELKKLHPSAPFYAGLLVKDAGDSLRAEVLFEQALEGSSKLVRGASARELLPLLTKKDSDSALAARILKLSQSDALKSDSAVEVLRNTALYVLGRYSEIHMPPGTDDFSAWNRGFSLMAGLHINKEPGEAQKQDIREYFFNGVIDEARIWTFQEIQKIPPPWMTAAETTAIEGRIAVSKSAFNEGITLFKTVLEQDQSLFFLYIDLLHDLGRAYQFTKYQEEGIKLFSDWEAWLRTGTGFGTSIFTIRIPETRYRLLYFIGRIERQRQNYKEAAAFFTDALKLAPSADQEDACMWYILNVTLQENPADIKPLLREYTARWNDDVYFTDIMDRVSRHLVSSRDWTGLLEVFSLIRGGNDGTTIAKYAYIIARAVMEGFISPDKAGPYLSVYSNNDKSNDTARSWDISETAAGFFRIAFEESRGSFYYRALSASFLGEKTDPVPGKPGAAPIKQTPQQLKTYPHGDSLEFLLNFFEFGAGSFAYSYFKDLPLTIDEQRIAAQGFILAENWDDAIRVCSVFMNREEYELQRQDMEMFYPRPYADLIEKNAKEARIPTEVFFGLIRTESAFNRNITSWAGAVGLSQLMPATALDMAGRIARQGGPNYIKDGEIDLLNPEINIHIGAWYLNYLIEYTGSPMLALISYNGGMGRVKRWRAAEPRLPEDLFLETIEYPETRDYGRKVLAAAAAYGYLYYGMSMEAVIADIFNMENN